jgi:hypothetical protein
VSAAAALPPTRTVSSVGVLGSMICSDPAGGSSPGAKDTSFEPLTDFLVCTVSVVFFTKSENALKSLSL